jgi:hypothetical protein
MFLSVDPFYQIYFRVTHVIFKHLELAFLKDYFLWFQESVFLNTKGFKKRQLYLIITICIDYYNF